MELLQVLVPCSTRCLGEVTLGFEILEWFFIFEGGEQVLRGALYYSVGIQEGFFFLPGGVVDK